MLHAAIKPIPVLRTVLQWPVAGLQHTSKTDGLRRQWSDRYEGPEIYDTHPSMETAIDEQDIPAYDNE